MGNQAKANPAGQLIEKIEKELARLGVKNYTIQPDGTVDVDGSIYLASLGLTSIPVKFGTVTGSFDCGWNQLTSLQGAPYHVGGIFWCSYNQLTSLQGAPAFIGGVFNCAGNPLLQEDIEELPLWQAIRELAGR